MEVGAAEEMLQVQDGKLVQVEGLAQHRVGDLGIRHKRRVALPHEAGVLGVERHLTLPHVVEVQQGAREQRQVARLQRVLPTAAAPGSQTPPASPSMPARLPQMCKTLTMQILGHMRELGTPELLSMGPQRWS